MVRIVQVRSFINHNRAMRIDHGTFPSLADAERELGWAFIADVCIVITA